MYSSARSLTNSPEPILNIDTSPGSFIHSVFGIAGYVKNGQQFDRTQVANTGTMVLCTNRFDHFDPRENLVTVMPRLTGVSSLDCPSIFVPKKSVTDFFEDEKLVPTYERPAAGIAWMRVISDDNRPFADDAEIDRLVPPEIRTACEQWEPVEIQICQEDLARSSQPQETTGSRYSRVFEGRFC